MTLLEQIEVEFRDAKAKSNRDKLAAASLNIPRLIAEIKRLERSLHDYHRPFGANDCPYCMGAKR